MHGSSPRVRGGRLQAFEERVGFGLIPASAGRTPWASLSSRRSPAHPRECGADGAQAAFKKMGDGSSPRVRGGPSFVQWKPDGTGLIPASAGRTEYVDPLARRWRAHPRECGADSHQRISGGASVGSSPRVRGGLGEHLHPLAWRGLIPASAGRTSPDNRPRQATGAHPRECGADFVHELVVDGCGGSSPRVRGGLPGTPSQPCSCGLIPASAGRT